MSLKLSRTNARMHLNKSKWGTRKEIIARLSNLTDARPIVAKLNEEINSARRNFLTIQTVMQKSVKTKLKCKDLCRRHKTRAVVRTLSTRCFTKTRSPSKCIKDLSKILTRSNKTSRCRHWLIRSSSN